MKIAAAMRIIRNPFALIFVSLMVSLMVGLTTLDSFATGQGPKRVFILNSYLKEKEVLLREVHHRVKNNMQVISSLLNMQSRNLTDAKTADILRASINRIRSMALIHDKLYQTEGLSRIDVRDYIQDLSRSLLRTYSVGPNINLDINVDPLFLGIDTVMPLGILINELVTNSLKHAFPGDRPGVVGISLKTQDGQGLVLTVSDNGIGIPAGLNHTNTESMGMQLVVTLVGTA